jgi:hypothetical protein
VSLFETHDPATAHILSGISWTWRQSPDGGGNVTLAGSDLSPALVAGTAYTLRVATISPREA